MNRRQNILLNIIGLLFFGFLFFWITQKWFMQKQLAQAEKEAISWQQVQTTQTEFWPESSGFSISQYLKQAEEDRKNEAYIKSMREYAYIKNLYSEFAQTHTYMGANIGEDYIKEGDIAPCLILSLYGEGDWCVQVCYDQSGMLSFGVSMPIVIEEKESTFENIAGLLSDTSSYYKSEIKSTAIIEFIKSNIDEGIVQKDTTFYGLKASVSIQDDFITVNFE